MAESIPAAPSTARRGAGPSSASGLRCCGGGACGCGLGLARQLVRRLRRQGRRVLCAARPPPTRRGCQCQYDPLSYARNFDLGDDAARVFSSRFVLAPSSAPAPLLPAASTADQSRLVSIK
ncbi:uncharacterized protein LOC133920692 [Phragmites australis]|uniref:uncharacterized protein LOC133920692 n=1 Tax=Phragmites australis TaxID=29695 RepID=UPI002D797FF7|nr:uncharacterized protein LOC133920692 [Phragmites australis]